MAQQNQKNNRNDKTQLSATTPPLGCAISFFFVFFVSCFLRFWFSDFLFSGALFVFLKGWQNNTKVKFLDLTLRGCKLAFGCFIVCFGSVVPSENQVKTIAKCRYHWGKLRGLGTQLGNFVCFCNFCKMSLKTFQQHRQPMNL